jgi:hypothetical protein
MSIADAGASMAGRFASEPSCSFNAVRICPTWSCRSALVLLRVDHLHRKLAELRVDLGQLRFLAAQRRDVGLDADGADDAVVDPAQCVHLDLDEARVAAVGQLECLFDGLRGGGGSRVHHRDRVRVHLGQRVGHRLPEQVFAPNPVLALERPVHQHEAAVGRAQRERQRNRVDQLFVEAELLAQLGLVVAAQQHDTPNRKRDHRHQHQHAAADPDRLLGNVGHLPPQAGIRAGIQRAHLLAQPRRQRLALRRARITLVRIGELAQAGRTGVVRATLRIGCATRGRERAKVAAQGRERAFPRQGRHVAIELLQLFAALRKPVHGREQLMDRQPREQVHQQHQADADDEPHGDQQRAMPRELGACGIACEVHGEPKECPGR